MLDILLDDENCQPFGANASDQLEQFLYDQWSETRGRLVHQQEPRPRHQRAANRTHLLLAAGERAGGLGSPLSQLWKELINPSKLFGKMAPRRWNEGADPQVVLHAELGKQTPVLGDRKSVV